MAIIETSIEGYFLDPVTVFRTEPLKQMQAYWRRLKGDRFAPARSEFDPAALRPWLPHILLFDVVDGGREFRVRLVGTHITAAYGYDDTGKTLAQATDAIVAERGRLLLSQCVDTRRPWRAFSDPVYGRHREMVFAEGGAFPLSSDGRSVDIVLSGLVIEARGRVFTSSQQT